MEECMLRHLVSLFAGTALLATAQFAATPVAEAQQVNQIRWATSSVGSSGHRALVALATLLNREMDDYEITVLPTPGAAASVRGFSAGQFDGYYGADVAYHEIVTRSGRYREFDPAAGNELLQSFWSFTLEIGSASRLPTATSSPMARSQRAVRLYRTGALGHAGGAGAGHAGFGSRT
jgi:uncharacterized protein